MEIFELVEMENSKILNTLRKLEDTSAHQPEERGRIFQDVQRRIERMVQLEEEYLYLLLQTDARTRDDAQTSRQQMRAIRNLLKEMDQTPPTDTRFKYLIERLYGEYQLHAEWEEKDFFKEAKKVVGPEQAILLGERAQSSFH
jgi:hypothetical protein